MRRLTKLGTVGSQFLNVLICNGQPDETLSGRAYRKGHLGGSPRWLRLMRFFNFIFRDPDHCKESHELDIKFARLILGITE